MANADDHPIISVHQYGVNNAFIQHFHCITFCTEFERVIWIETVNNTDHTLRHNSTMGSFISKANFN
jgi:hypothetical protein